MKRAFVFAGQGRRPSRGQLELANELPGGQALLHQAALAAGLPSAEDFLARGGRALDSTRVLQPLVVAVSLALTSILPEPDLVAGHSLGELSAVTAAGGMAAQQAVALAAVRGAAMQQASENAPGGLYAIHPAHLPAALENTNREAFVALDNAPDELVLGGNLQTAATLARTIPGRRLDVAGPFHGPTMRPAALLFATRLATVPSTALRTAMVSCVEPNVATCSVAARNNLVAGLTRTVRFREALLRLYEEGARTFVVIGPGATVRSLIRRTLSQQVNVLTTETRGDLDRIRMSKEAA